VRSATTTPATRAIRNASTSTSTSAPHTQRHYVYGAARRRERGATAVEFALLFPLFFVIFYAIVAFSLVFVAQQSLTLAAEEGARAVLNFQQADSLADALSKRVGAACTTATGMANWLAADSTCTST